MWLKAIKTSYNDEKLYSPSHFTLCTTVFKYEYPQYILEVEDNKVTAHNLILLTACYLSAASKTCATPADIHEQETNTVEHSDDICNGNIQQP